jgi:hypothetical protein
MNWSGQWFCAAALLLLSWRAYPQVPTQPAKPGESNTVTQAVPPPPTNKSPVAVFRELLAMTPEERRQFLSNRPAESRELILAKVRAYQSLKPDLRELRLQVTELRWYLLPLMNTPPTNRTAQMMFVPTNFHHLVIKRLEIWDKLPAEDQMRLLKNEAVVRYLTEVSEDKGTGTELTEKRRQLLTNGIVEWQALTEEQRNRVKQGFDQFFGLNSEEKSKALNTLSEAERQQIEKALKGYAKLSAAQRAQCIRSFEKFANLTLTERQQFLKNAERWKLMSPGERQAWRDLVGSLQTQPPLPPNVDGPPPPPNAETRSSGRVAATNSH